MATTGGGILELAGSMRWLIIGLALLSGLTVTLACWVLLWQRWSSRRDVRVSRQSHVLALSFARLLTGRLDAGAVREIAARAKPDVFWRALETFADSVAGEEWTMLSEALAGLDHVERERRRLQSGGRWARSLAARHLGMIDAPANREPLRRAMAAGPSTVTLMAAVALARIHDHAALVWLLDHADALEPLSRHQLVSLIKRFGRDSAPTLRFGLAAADFERPTGLAAVDVLGLWRDAESREMLEALLCEGGLEARIAAARALGNIATPESVPSLCAALSDAAWQVRAQAARALGGHPGAAAIAALDACLSDVSWWVRRNAAYAIGSLGAEGEALLRQVAKVHEDAYARGAASEVLQALQWDAESPGGLSRVE
jgi:HEAT repeat protein